MIAVLVAIALLSAPEPSAPKAAEPQPKCEKR